MDYYDLPSCAKTTAVICTLLGALLGISTATYYKDNSYLDEEGEDE